MNIKEKYKKLRPDMKHGDVILFRGKRPLSKIIQNFDGDAYFNHVGIILKISGALFIIDSNAGGVEPGRLSERIEKYIDFKIMRSTLSEGLIEEALETVLLKPDSKQIKYDFVNGAKAMFNRKLNKDIFKVHLTDDNDICSMFTRPYALRVLLIKDTMNVNRLFFPQDYERFKNKVIEIG